MKKKLRAWVISVDMGYGHQRAAYALKDIVNERIITANNDTIISTKDHKFWENMRKLYEAVSRWKQIPIIGKIIFGAYDKFMEIAPFFPYRDLSRPSLSTLRLKRLIKRGLCKGIVDYTLKDDIPVLTTHFVPAMAYNYNKKKIFCIATDTDINRIWVPDNPKESLITYFSPCRHVSKRLRQYGVQDTHIIETGFPLPKENIGKDMKILKNDIIARLVNLDPEEKFFVKYGTVVKTKVKNIDLKNLKKYKTHIFTLTFAIGGAGAQADIGLKVLKSLQNRIMNNYIRLNILVGTKVDLKVQYEKEIEKLGLSSQIGKNVNIVFGLDKKTYFDNANLTLRTTDVLWTKPSEMSFYTGLGIPIIIAPPIGAHEHFNREWLEHIGSGFVEEDPEFTHDWLYYWLNDGRLADAALQGYLDAPFMGTYNIEGYLEKLYK